MLKSKTSGQGTGYWRLHQPTSVRGRLLGHGEERDGKATTRGHLQTKTVTLLHRTTGDSVGLGVLLVVGILGIGIDRADVFLALVEEVETKVGLVAVLVALAANEPTVRALGLCLLYTSPSPRDTR